MRLQWLIVLHIAFLLKAAGDLLPIQLFLFQKDGGDNLVAWLDHHVELFGAESIHIVDHQSKDPRTLRVLADHAARGVTLHTCTDKFTAKMLCLSRVINAYKTRSKLVAPIDVDEFIVFRVSLKQMRADKAQVARELASLECSPDAPAYKFVPFQAVPSDCPCSRNQAQPNSSLAVCSSTLFHVCCERRLLWKTFFCSDAFAWTDQGNHFGSFKRCQTPPKLKFEQCFAISRLGLLHYATSSYATYEHKVLERAAAYNFSNSHVTCTGVGHQYCSWYRADRATRRYLYTERFCRFEPSSSVTFTQLSERFRCRAG